MKRPRRRTGAIVVLIGACMALATIFVLEARRRRGLYWYDVGSDYRFELTGGTAQRLPARITANGFDFPAWDSPWSSAFLEVDVDSRVTATWFEPSVEVVVDGTPACRQFFERSASGKRHINLCVQSGDVHAGARIDFRSRHIAIREQEARLLLFPAPGLDSARILVLAPHADDAEIAAFGLYAGRESWVVTITTGSYPGRKYAELAPDTADRERLQARLRIHDSLVVPQWAGIDPDHVLNLGYYTGALATMFAQPSRVIANPVSGAEDMERWRSLNRSSFLPARRASSTWASLVRDLTELLASVRPTLIVAPHPALDANPDHVFTTAALFDALASSEHQTAQLFLYTNHHVLSEYYPFGPSDAAVTLPPWLDSSVGFRSLYSHPLDDLTQRDKLFALDQMHDLRPAPRRVTAGPVATFLNRIASMAAELWRDPVLEYSYYRRAVRPNELFFVYESSDVKTLRQVLPQQPSWTTQESADSVGTEIH